MTFLLTAVVSLLVFGSVIFVHELGHFLAARASGIRVEEFSIGIGPRLFSRTGRDGTRYSLRLLPLGGYNLFSSAEPAEGDEDETLSQRLDKMDAEARNRADFPATVAGMDFEEAPAPQRFFVTLSGALMNFVLGAVLMVVLAASLTALGSTTVADFAENSSSAAVLQAGDVILQVDGTRCRTSYSLVNCFDGTEKQHTLTVLRNGNVLTLQGVTVSPQRDENGTLLSLIDFRVVRAEKTPRSIARQAMDFFDYYSTAILRSFAELATGKTGVDQLTGPVGTVSAVQQAIAYGWQDVISLMALLTINIGIFNLLPVPALDGCKLLFLLYECVTRRRVPAKVQVVVNAAGMALLMGLMLLVTMQDVIRIV